ncbi:MAG: hypothetical protein ACYDCC_13315 [Actinomycetota bacterium]
MMIRRICIALSFAALYVIVAAATSGSLLPVRPVYEGIGPPPPYSWVNPPSSRKSNNVPPTQGDGVIAMGPKGSEPGTVSTDDGQAVMTFFRGSFEAKKGQTKVHVHITPVDPATLGPPPQGLFYDGNAYKFTATYEPSGQPAIIPARDCPIAQNPKICPTLVLRYAFSATSLYWLSSGSWTSVSGATPVGTSLQIFADVHFVGTFVAIDSKSTVNAKPAGGGSSIGSILAIVFAAVAVLIGLVGSRIRARNLKRKRAAAKKGKPRKSLPKR